MKAPAFPSPSTGVTMRAFPSLAFATLLFVAARPLLAVSPEQLSFTIQDIENGDCGDGEGWTSQATATYRLCTAWHTGQPRPEVMAVLTEAGLKPGDLKTAERSPRELFRRRGSLLALRPGERLLFYLAELKGTSTEKKTNEQGSVITTGDAEFLHKTSHSSWDDRTQEGMPRSSNPDAELVRTAAGAILWFGQGRVPAAGLTDFMGTYTILPGASGWRKVFVFTLNNAELANWPTLHRTNHGYVTNGDGGGIDYQAQLMVTQPPPPAPEVEVSGGSAYATWVPEGSLDDASTPGNSLQLTVKVHEPGDPSKPRRAKLVFRLSKVSDQKGVCGNWPQSGAVGKGLRFRKEDFAGDEHLAYKDEGLVESIDPVEEATLPVQAYDYGAYGLLTVTAKDEAGRDGTVKANGKETPDLAIPLDDNHNHIADTWELRAAGNLGGQETDDEETVPGQDAKGDGITLYNEYRGLVVREGGLRSHRRLSPTRKEMFVLDPQGGFPGALWKDRTGIEVIPLDEDLVNASANSGGSPLVNFSAKDGAAHPFYALRVKVIQGDTDPSPASDGAGHTQPATTTDPSAPLMAYASSSGSIKSADYIKVFPDRAALLVDHYLKWLDLGLKSPDSVPGQEVRDPKNLFTPDEALQALSLLGSPQARSALALKIRNVLFIHEVGHICGGLPDHEGNPPPGYKDAARACFMWNPSLWDRRRMIVLTALGRGDSSFAYAYSNFCRDLPVAGFSCYRLLNIKDW